MLLLVSAALTFHAPLIEGGVSQSAAGKIEAGQGTISFWWKPNEGTIFQVNPAQPLHDGDSCMRIFYASGSLRFQVRDRNIRDYFGQGVRFAVPAGRAFHLALTWSELTGAALYVNGGRVSAVTGPLYLRQALGSFSFPGGTVEDVRVYSGPLDVAGVQQLANRQAPALTTINPPPPTAGRYGWHAAANIPHGSRFRVRKIEIEDARAVNRFWWKLVDGRRETVWPAAPPAWRYRDENSNYRISPVAEAFNVVRSTGDAVATIQLGDGLNAPRPGGQELHYFNFRNPLLIDEVVVQVHSGLLAEVECLRMEPLDADDVPRGVVTLPATRETAVRGVRVELDATPGEYYYFAVSDPEDPARRIVEFDLRANARRATVELEFTPYLVGPGQSMRVESSTDLRGVVWLGSDTEQSRAAHLERRHRELRDAVQASPDAAPLAEWTEPAAPEGVPRWAWQQVKLVARLKELADWWIDYRQIGTGEFGNGPDSDADLIGLLPAVARMDGNGARYREASRLVFEWLLRDGYIDAARRAAAAAVQLDRGDPLLAEAAMELSRRGPAASSQDGPTAAPLRDIEGIQGNLWRELEQRFEWFTTGEPQTLDFSAAPVEAIRLGPHLEVSWDSTGGELAAVVEETALDNLRLRAYSMSRAPRRVRMGVWRLDHGVYEVTMGGASPRRVTLKPPAFVELDLPAGQTVSIQLRLVERKTPIASMPDLAVSPQEISSDGRGLMIPVHNLGLASAGRFRVAAYSPDGEKLAEAVYAGLEAPGDLRPRVLLARFAELAAAPGMRVEVRLDSGEEALESNNIAVVPAKQPATPGGLP